MCITINNDDKQEVGICSEPQEPAPEVEAVVAAVNEVEIEKKEDMGYL
jgi:hypothetical protein